VEFVTSGSGAFAVIKLLSNLEHLGDKLPWLADQLTTMFPELGIQAQHVPVKLTIAQLKLIDHVDGAGVFVQIIASRPLECHISFRRLCHMRDATENSQSTLWTLCDVSESIVDRSSYYYSISASRAQRRMGMNRTKQSADYLQPLLPQQQ
jgi:hypothetical protein